jgi:hypothetical protein
MSAELQRPEFQTEEEQLAPRKKGIITGVRDRSEVEAMIQRYLELAHSALQGKRPAEE